MIKDRKHLTTRMLWVASVLNSFRVGSILGHQLYLQQSSKNGYHSSFIYCNGARQQRSRRCYSKRLFCLAGFYIATNRDNWTDSSNWLSGEGVEIGAELPVEENRVTAITF